MIDREAVDTRRGINGLSMLVVKSQMGELPLGKSSFVFVGRRLDSIKILYFHKTGFCLWQKRLEEARFPWPRKFTEDIVHLWLEQFAWLLVGYNVFKVQPFKIIDFEIMTW